MATESKWTPGPWETDNSEHDQPYLPIKIRAGKHHTICTVWIDDAPVRDFNAEQEANARLIVAAPGTYDALDKARLFIEYFASTSGCYLPTDEILDCVNSALAKARGEAS